jgi:hypothetical protein
MRNPIISADLLTDLKVTAAALSAVISLAVVGFILAFVNAPV